MTFHKSRSAGARHNAANNAFSDTISRNVELREKVEQLEKELKGCRVIFEDYMINGDSLLVRDKIIKWLGKDK